MLPKISRPMRRKEDLSYISAGGAVRRTPTYLGSSLIRDALARGTRLHRRCGHRYTAAQPGVAAVIMADNLEFDGG